MTSQVKSFLGVEEVFLDQVADLEHLKNALSELSLTDALIWSARLNLIVSNPEYDAVEVQKLVLQWFFTKEQSEDIWKKSKQFTKSVVCMRSGLLELMRWILLWCKIKEHDGKTFRDPNVRQHFAKAMMIANKIWFDTTDFAQITTRPVNDENREKLLLACRRNHEGSYIGHVNPIMWVGFGYSIFCRKKYVQKHYPDLEKDFLEATGIGIDDYYICKCFAMSHIYTKTLQQIASDTKNNNGLFNMNNADEEILPSMKPAVLKYLDIESQTIEELKKGFWGNTTDISSLEDAGSFDPRVLLGKPILRVGDGRGIVLDSLYLTERAAAAPIFIISRKLNKPMQQLIGYYGQAFEDYVHFFFKKIYSTRTNTLGVEMERDQNEGDVDISLKLNRQLVLMEIKAAFLNLDVIYGTSNDAYLEELKGKYVHKWGAEQLATAISNLESGMSVNGIESNSVERIYPILFVRDPHLDAALHPWFLAREFKKKLQPDEDTGRGDMKKQNHNIPNLILMTVDDLLFLEDSIHRGINFHQFLSDYTLEHGSRLQSIHDFMSLNSRYKDRIYKYKILGRHTYKLMVKARKKLFRNGSDGSGN